MRRIADNIKLLIVLVFCAIFVAHSPAFAIKNSKPDIQISEPQNNVYVSKINFEEVLKKAKEHSYDLRISDYNILIAHQGIRGARSEYFPKLNFIAGTEYTKNYRDIRDTTVMSLGDAFINPYTRYQSMLGIMVSYNLFDFGIRGENLKLSKEEKDLKELETEQKLQELNLTLLDTYTKILITTKQIELNREILKLEENNLELQNRLLEAKEISKTDFNDINVKVADVKSRISDLKSIRSESLNWLSFYTGEQYDADNLQVENLKKDSFDVLSFKDYSKSIIWRIHEKNILKKEHELNIAKRTNLPRINVYGRYYLYGSNHNSYNEALKGIEPSNFSVGASLNTPLFDGFKNSANVKKTELELKQLYVERDKAIAQLMTRLASMRSNLIYLEEQLEENNKAYNELKDKEKSMARLLGKKMISPIEANETKIERLNKEIEIEKNRTTHLAIVRGIEILSEADSAGK